LLRRGLRDEWDVNEQCRGADAADEIFSLFHELGTD
jgi:hypothetical protein